MARRERAPLVRRFPDQSEMSEAANRSQAKRSSREPCLAAANMPSLVSDRMNGADACRLGLGLHARTNRLLHLAGFHLSEERRRAYLSWECGINEKSDPESPEVALARTAAGSSNASAISLIGAAESDMR